MSSVGPQHPPNKRPSASNVRAAILIGASLVFAADLIVPLGLAVAVPYVAIVLLSLWLPGRGAIFKTAGLLTGLAIAGFFAPYPAGPFFWMAVHNRSMTLFVLWMTAVLGHFLRRAQETIHAERDFNESLIETASSIILLLDSDGRIVRFNRYTTEVAGYELREVQGEDWFEAFVPERERLRGRGIFQHCIENGIARESLFPIVTRDGIERQFSWSSKPMQGADGRIVGLLYVGQDITALLDAQRRAINSERLAAIGQTIATLSHESRNELQALKIGIDMLSASISDPAGRELIGHLQESRARLERLFEDIRQFAGPIRLERSVQPVSAVWRRAWSSLGPLRVDRTAELHEDPTCTELECSIDPLRLEQIFRNLFENSLAAASDPVWIEIGCSTLQRGEQSFLRICVRDNGPGISPEARNRVFEPFYTTKWQGTGLGMAISRRIVETHGGELSLSSEAGSGAEFVIVLPGTSRQDTVDSRTADAPQGPLRTGS